MRSMETIIILKRLSLLMILMCLHPQSGYSTLITFPCDTEVLVNLSTYFNCSTSILSEHIHWYHNRVGENRTNYVYYKGQFNQIYAERYSITKSTKTGEYNLIIRSVKPEDAGRYVCQDDGGLGDLSSAELIVLDSIPEYLFSMKPDGFIGPNSCSVGLPMETLQLSCSVSYFGNSPPLLQWKMVGNDAPILKGIANYYSGKRATVNLTTSSTVEMDGKFLACSTTRSQEKLLSCTTDAVKINYAVGQPTILNVAKGEIITCSANASVTCTYRWFYGNDTQLYPVSSGQVLTTNRSGDHSCEASCPINGINCTFVAMRVVVFEDEKSTASKDTTKTLLLAILIPTVVVLLIATCILFFVIRKGQKKQPTSSADQVIKKNTEPNAPIIREGVEMDPLLPAGNSGIIQKSTEKTEITIKASKKMSIAGVAALDDLIYVVSNNSSEVETFDTSTFDFKTIFVLKDLANPWDLASCKKNKLLYVMDRSLTTTGTSNHIVCIGTNDGLRVLNKWSTEKEHGNLSVASDGNVIVTFCDSRRLVVYGSDGTKLKDMPLSVDMNHPSHALKLRDGGFLICHGINEDETHRVCILDEDGKLIKKSSESMGTPSYLAVDDAEWVFVVDQGNSRVIVLSSDLELIGEVASRENGLPCPQRICLNMKTGRVIVVDTTKCHKCTAQHNNASECRRKNRRLLIDFYDSKHFLTRSCTRNVEL